MINKDEWIKIKKSEFFTFYSLGQEIKDKTYFNKCDKHVKKICKLFKLDFKKIKNFEYCILPSKDEYKRILGRSSSGETKKNCIYSLHLFHPHEIAHAIVGKFLGYARPKIFSEGVAVFLGWNNSGPVWRSKPLKFWLNKYYKKIDIELLLADFSKFDGIVSYPVSGCFVGFLIEKFNAIKFKKLYKQMGINKALEDQKKIIEKITGVLFKDLIKQFYDFYDLK